MFKTLKGPLWEQVLVIFRADISSDVNHVAEEKESTGISFQWDTNGYS